MPGYVVVAEHEGDERGEVAVVEHSGTDVDGDGQIETVELPAHELCKGFVEDELREVADESGLLRHRYEVARWDQPVHRVVPPNERFHTGRLASSRPQLWLVMEAELPLVDGVSELADEAQPHG